MRRKLSLAIAIAVLHLTSAAGHADQVSKSAKVEEFFRLAKMDEMLRQTLTLATNQFKSGVIQQMLGVKLPPEMEKRVDAFEEKVTAAIGDALAWEKLKPDYVKLFAGAYTEAEIDDILAFYRSPTGQSMVAKSPSLMAKSGEIVQQRLSETQSQVQALMREFISEAMKDINPQPKKDKRF